MVRTGTAVAIIAVLVRKVDREMPVPVGGALIGVGTAWQKVHRRALKTSSSSKKRAAKSLVVTLMKKKGSRNRLKKIL
jgi:hypothetical protein